MNKYEILGVSGEGAYGVVLKCRNKETGDLVAIKKFKDTDDPNDQNFRKTTLREVKILKNVRHPNIVLLREAFKRKQRLYLVFEYCEKTLLEIIEENPGGLPLELTKHLAFQTLRSMEYLWSYMEIFHRDLKPENLLLVRSRGEWVVKLCDFGFARHISMAGASSQPGVAYPPNNLTDYVATRWYRSPELLLNATDYNQTVDIWACALIIAEMLTSEPLFAGDSDVDQLFLIQRVLGNLTRKQMEKFLRNPKFIGVSFPDSRPEGLERRLSGKIKDKAAVSLLKAMLQMDPSNRPSATQCLGHPFFDSVREKCLQLELRCMSDMGIKGPQDAQASGVPQPSGQSGGHAGGPAAGVLSSSPNAPGHGRGGYEAAAYPPHTQSPVASLPQQGLPMAIPSSSNRAARPFAYALQQYPSGQYPPGQSMLQAQVFGHSQPFAPPPALHGGEQVEEGSLPMLPTSRSGSRAAKARELPSRVGIIKQPTYGYGVAAAIKPVKGYENRGLLSLPKIKDTRFQQ